MSIFRKKEKRDYHIPANLTAAEKKEVREIIERAKQDDGIPRTAQQSIPFERMFQDGICRIGSDYYTKTIQFQDINYQLALQEDKTEIFEEWCAFLNFFDSSVHFELSFMNMATDVDDFRTGIAIPHRKDEFNGVRDEYSSMLFHQINLNVLDGTQWSVVIKFSSGKAFKSYGSNRFPYNFSGFLDLVRISESDM